MRIPHVEGEKTKEGKENLRLREEENLRLREEENLRLGEEEDVNEYLK